MKHRRLVVAVLVATFALFGATQALARSHDITGYPDQINKVDLDGYVLQTSYPLGNNAGNTFKQTYLADGKFSAECVSGPFFPCAGGANYVAMPVGPKQLMVTWYLDAGHVVEQARRTALALRLARPDQGPVVRRRQAQGHQGPLQDDQATAREVGEVGLGVRLLIATQEAVANAFPTPRSTGPTIAQ